MEKIRVAVIGAGRIGRLHAENLVRHFKDVEVVAIADIVQEKAESCARELGIGMVLSDPVEIFDDKLSIDAVLICTSTEAHAQLIIKAAEAHKHVFCEKPIAFSLEEINQCLEAIERSRIKFMVGFNRRFDLNFARAKEIITQGKIGQAHLLKISSRDPAPPPLDYIKSSGGLFVDMTIHDFDMARFLMGEEVVEIFSLGGVLIDPAIGRLGDLDTAVVVMRFDSGAIGVIDNSRQAVYGYDQRVEVFGNQGMVVVSNPQMDTTLLWTKDGYQGSGLPYFFIERYTSSYIKELEAFFKALKLNQTPPVTGRDGKIATVMAYAAKHSLETGRPIRLKEIDSQL